MSYDPIRNTTSITTQGDINAGRGMLGMTTLITDTAITPINQVPGSTYSDYFSHYLINITINGEFNLGAIGTNLSIGYSCCVDCIANASANTLTVKSSIGATVAILKSGDKLFLVATAGGWKTGYALPQGLSPLQDNYTIIYTSGSPHIGLLALQKELYVNAGNQYGIKSIASFDFTEQTGSSAVTNHIVNLAGRNEAFALDDCTAGTTHCSIASLNGTFTPNGNSISGTLACTGTTFNNVQGSQNIVAIGSRLATFQAALVSATPITNGVLFATNDCQISVNSTNGTCSNVATIASELCDMRVATAGVHTFSNALIAASYNGCYIQDSRASTILGSTLSHVQTSDYSGILFAQSCNVNTASARSFIAAALTCNIASSNSFIIGASTSTVNTSPDSGVLSSTGVTIQASASTQVESSTGTNNINGCTGCQVSSSESVTFATSNKVTSMSGFTNSVSNAVLATTIASDNVIIAGDGNGTFNAGTGYANTRGGVTVLSSHALDLGVGVANNIRYCVVGGYNAPTWSIDSKTGVHYGSNFNSSQALPGFAEMYPNLIAEPIPYARLLQIENGKVRLAQDGEQGFMISRSHESAAFVGGNPMYEWPGKYLRDSFGDFITSIDESGEVVRQLNPDFDSSKSYLPRSDRRDQWTTCEKSGVLPVEAEGVSVGDYVISGPNGVAKRSTRKTNIRILAVTAAADDNVNDIVTAVADISNQCLPTYVDLAGSIVSKVAVLSDKPTTIDGITLSDELVVDRQRQVKIVISVMGDVGLATDLLMAATAAAAVINPSSGNNLSSGNSGNTWFSTSYARTNGGYRVTSVLKAVLEPGTYKINFVTSKALPTSYTGVIKY